MITFTFHVPCHYTVRFSTLEQSYNSQNAFITSSFNAKKSMENKEITRSRRITVLISTVLFPITFLTSSAPSHAVVTEFYELPHSGGVKALDLRLGDGSTPVKGDQVAIHYYGRLAAKQGWCFDSTYDHKDSTGESIPFTFVLGSSTVISGIEATVRSMKVGGIRRVIIPPSQGYQNTNQEPLPPNFFDRQRLFTTIFNPTRLANGEGSTLGTLVFDIELVNVKH
ncbi:hypothetical protein KSS87_004490 [Heliosperma pusillum]|nr:hypothetical protein KSS87_004490 [Heliosperma pusillum]